MPQLMTLGAKAPGGVCLAVPSYGALSPVFVFALAASIRELTSAGINYDLIVLGGNCHVDDARNSIVRSFLDGTCDSLLFIDSDLTWSPEDLVRLVQHERDVVGGAYPHKKDERTFPIRHLKTDVLQADADGLLEVEALPGGFLKISRSALLQLSTNEYYEQEGDKTLTPLIFERLTEGTTRFSGDYVFCRKWRATGGKVYLDPEIHFGHCGEKEWRGCYGAHLRAENKLPLRGILLTAMGEETSADLRALHEEWGNGIYAAPPEMLEAVITIVRSLPAGSTVLELGSGLTTLCMAVANPSITIHVAEHDPHYYNRINAMLALHQISNVFVYLAPIVNQWYDTQKFPALDADVVVIDGPPRNVGNRLTVFGAIDTSGTLIIDDMTDEMRAALRLRGRDFTEVGRFAISAPSQISIAA